MANEHAIRERRAHLSKKTKGGAAHFGGARVGKGGPARDRLACNDGSVRRARGIACKVIEELRF